MLLGLGNRVRFVHTGAEGKIVDRMDDGMFIVELDGGIEIPAFEEHLERVDVKLEGSSVKGKVVPGKSPKPVQKIPLPERQYELLRGEGILMAFEAVKRDDGSTQRYSVYLINATPYEALYEWEIQLKKDSLKKINGKVDVSSVYKLMEMQADYLSDNPTIVISTRQVSTEGMSDWVKKEFKLKPKQFFQRFRTAPLLDRMAYVYKLFDAYEIKEKKESLRSYTKKNAAPMHKSKPVSLYKKWDNTDVKKFADFPLEKDFHIEKLVTDFSKMNNGEILRLQLGAFQKYMAEAIRLGVEKVFLIHGVGKGKLRDEIASILIRMPEVETFKNEFHPRYGNGSTEVIFKKN